MKFKRKKKRYQKVSIIIFKGGARKFSACRLKFKAKGRVHQAAASKLRASAILSRPRAPENARGSGLVAG